MVGKVVAYAFNELMQKRKRVSDFGLKDDIIVGVERLSGIIEQHFKWFHCFG